MSTAITCDDLKRYEESFEAQRANLVAMNAVMNAGVYKASQNHEAARETVHEFSVNLKPGEITTQKNSGRCWMFAALNCLRFEVMRKLNLETFELSQNYTLFYDKLEKANYFLESILETLDEATDSRLIAHLLTAPVEDGGQWDMLCNLVRKYGLVPKSAMEETVCSSNTRELNRVLTVKLREFACRLRRGHREGKNLETLREEKREMMDTVYRILAICLGRPPEKFDLEVRDKDENFHRETGLTPRSFYDKYIGVNLDDYVSLINAPTGDKPFHRSYSVKFLGNVKEGLPVRYLNLEVQDLKRAAVAQLKDGQPVWFGSDVGQSSASESGLMDLNVRRADLLFDTEFAMDKAERLEYGESLMTHAMVLLGVNLDQEGRPNRWRVENSWGKKLGRDGYFVMTDDWFSEYVYQVVVHKKYLTPEQQKEFESEPILLEPWDPMGSLAR